MNPSSYEDIAIHLVANDRQRAQFQVRDIGRRLAQGSRTTDTEGNPFTPYTPAQAAAAVRARSALIKELLKTD